MRGCHHVIQLHQRRILIQRFTLEHVQTCRTNPLMAQCINHRCFVNNLAPRDVDEDAFRTHQRKLPGADQPLGLRRQRQGQADEIGLLEQVFQAAVLRIKTRLDSRFTRLAVIDHRHAKSEMTTLRQRLANAAHADDAQHLAMHIGAKMRRAEVALPLTAAHHVRQLDHAPGGGKDQGETGVCGGFGQHVRGVGQQNLAAGQVIDVVVVDAHRHTGNGLQLWRQIEQCGVEFQAGAQQAMGAGQGITQLHEAVGIEAFDQRHIKLILQSRHERGR